jgi:phosphoribosylformylglycinamidine synthase subunit PurQ / glutaminase
MAALPGLYAAVCACRARHVKHRQQVGLCGAAFENPRAACHKRAMQTAVIVFPGSNCDRDAASAFSRVSGRKASMVWHKDTTLPDGTDIVVLPGGFSYGDYLRSGAMAARAPIMAAVRRHAARGALVIGICNGFQVLTEAGLLPGALLRNAGQKFVCRDVTLERVNDASPFTRTMTKTTMTVPVAHHDGCYFADAETLARLEGQGQVAFRYHDNPNGSLADIAGVLNENGTVLGMMPHPERSCDPAIGRTEGWDFITGFAGGRA